MKTHLYPTALYRVPLFPMDANLEDSWEALKEAISLSSTEFFQIIKDVKKEELEQLPTATKNTIWKYFNRARFRCTPYATFAGVGLCNIKNRPENPILTLAEKPTNHTYIDWPHKDEIIINKEQIEKEDLLLLSNSSYYSIGEDIRYISHFDDAFQLSEIGQNEFVQQILKACLKPISFSNLKESRNTITAEETEDLLNLIEELISLQLLFTSRHPNIIGEDYFKRINAPIEQFEGKYILSERKTLSGELDATFFKEIPAAIAILQNLLPPSNEPEPLQQFINRFSQKFEGQQIPIMQALDPELGVGYGDFETAGESKNLANRLAGKKEDKKANAKDEFQQLMLAQMMDGTYNGKVIHLDKIKGTNEQPQKPLPNSLCVMLTLVDEQLCIDSIGGSSANTLLGRFTLAGENFQEHCQILAKLEQEANPEVLFFDVAYIAEGKVDNVNRRAAIYPFQLSILNYDTSTDPLNLDDLFLYVMGGQLMIRSKKLNKRLVPRFSTAYNYGRSDLSLFRLLCDLQNQGIQSGLNIDLSQLFPNAPYYPRIQYKNLILAPAKWKIDYSELQLEKENFNNVATLKTHLQSKGISPVFKAGNSDQTLQYQLENETDLQAFLTNLRKQKKLYIEEAFIPQNSQIIDQHTHGYQCQALVSLNHSEQIYRDFAILPTKIEAPNIKKNIAPGKEWLYFEIYSHIHRQEEILLGKIQYFLTQHQAQIEKWFFIRYNENGEHLRLRIKLRTPGEGQKLTEAINDLLDEEIQSGTITELLLKTYKRETQRYGWSTIEAVESHFATDSQYVMGLLEHTVSDTEKYKLCLKLMQNIQQSEVFNPKEFTYITGKVSGSFQTEHHLETADFKELNSLYKEFKSVQMPILNPEPQQAADIFLQSFIKTVSLFPILEKRSLLTDLFHMHVNRLFSTNQRSHEMIIYYFLGKEIQRKQAQKTVLKDTSIAI